MTRHAVIAALVLGLAGCSSSSSSGVAAQNSTSGTTTPASATTTNTAAAAPATTTSSAANPHQPADACTLLTSDQVSAAIGTPGPYNDAQEDPAADGSPVWGCTWGSQDSFADLQEAMAGDVDLAPASADVTTTPLSGIGDKAVLTTMKPDGRNPKLFFAAGGGYYDLSVVYSRSELSPANADLEEAAEKTLAKLLAAKLSS